jgi:putative transposase
VAIIWDVFSRRCIGWAAAHHYRTDLTPAALRMALQRRQPQGGLIHRSDRGSQYASMSRAGMPSDNAVCERFMRTFKEEEILIRDYVDVADAIDAAPPLNEIDQGSPSSRRR